MVYMVQFYNGGIYEEAEFYELGYFDDEYQANEYVEKINKKLLQKRDEYNLLNERLLRARSSNKRCEIWDEIHALQEDIEEHILYGISIDLPDLKRMKFFTTQLPNMSDWDLEES